MNRSRYVLIELKVVENEASSNADDVRAAIANDGMVKGIIMDTDVFKTVNSDAPVKITEIDQNDHGVSLVTVVFHLPTELQGKNGYAIFRYHGSQVDKITETANTDGEYIVVNAAKDTITAYLKKFSTYAIAYVTGAVNPPVVNPPSNIDDPVRDPIITSPTQGQAVTAAVGNTATVSVTAIGTAPIRYQWQINRNDGNGWINIGTNSNSYITGAVALNNNGYQYRCIASNVNGSDTSPVFTLNVIEYIDVPKTGDTANPALWLGIGLMGLVAMGATAYIGKRKQAK